MSNFEKALAYTFRNEGSFSDHPADRGGATSGFGITQEELARWRRHPVSKLDVRNMFEAEAKDIYFAWYWKPLGCHLISNDSIATAIFDLGVVRGIGIPGRYAQEILNSHGARLAIDGKVGPRTLDILNATDPAVFIPDYATKARNGFLAIVAGRPSQVVFIRGWLARARRYLTLLEK